MTLLPGGSDDSYAVFQVLNSALADLNTRLGGVPAYRISEAEHHNRMWAERQPHYEYLAQLTELFSLPEAQSRGWG